MKVTLFPSRSAFSLALPTFRQAEQNPFSSAHGENTAGLGETCWSLPFANGRWQVTLLSCSSHFGRTDWLSLHRSCQQSNSYLYSLPAPVSNGGPSEKILHKGVDVERLATARWQNDQRISPNHECASLFL